MARALTITICLIFLSSCGARETPVVTRWTGPYAGMDVPVGVPPVCVIWYRPDSVVGWREYKKLTAKKDLHATINSVTGPEIEGQGDKSDQKLSIFFYDGNSENLRVQEVFFHLDGDTFVGPVGRSKALCELLLKTPESQPFFTPIDPNVEEKSIKGLPESLHRRLDP